MNRKLVDNLSTSRRRVGHTAVKEKKMKLTKAQRQALKKVYQRTEGTSYLTFRRTVQMGWGCIMVPFAGMWLGIEPDGYTHS